MEVSGSIPLGSRNCLKTPAASDRGGFLAVAAALCSMFARTAARPAQPLNQRHYGREDRMLAYLWVALGSALGGVARYWCSNLVAARFGGPFPGNNSPVKRAGQFRHWLSGTLTSRRMGDGRWDPGNAALRHDLGYAAATTFEFFHLQTLDLLRGGCG